VIFYGTYRFHHGAYRPFITAWVLSTRGKWVKTSFLVDTGADETFLFQRSISALGIDTSSLDVQTDVGGIGGSGVPYFRWQSQLVLKSPGGQRRLFGGEINVFLDPHAARFPIIGRDVLDSFVVIFDRAENQVLLLDKPDSYKVVRAQGR
jgi:hypothetical protein